MKLFYTIGFIYLVSIFGINAQTNTEDFKNKFEIANDAFSKVYQNGKSESIAYAKGGYADVIPALLELYKQDSSNMNLAFKLGVCYRNSRTARKLAIPYFSKASASVSDNCKENSYKEKKAPLITLLYLGDAYHLNYEFDKAIAAYEKFIALMAENKSTDKALLAETNRKIEMCKAGKNMMAGPVKVKIQNLGSNVNSAYADYAPVLTADQNYLFFTSRRQETTGGQKDDLGNYMEDIYMCSATKTGWTKAVGIGPPVNTDGNEATIGISPDGQTILIYKDDRGDGNIYSTTLSGDVWGTPVKLNDNINSKYWEPSGFISADGSTLYFVSDRPGGYGGRDLYVSKLTPEGDWGKAINMGPNINTPYEEDAPCIHADGITLSFSSNGHNTMGGFDVFTSLLSEDGTWSEPVNVGYPINTTDDDVFYVVSPDSKKAYFTSFREGGLGEKDIYTVTYLDRKEAPLTLVKGTVTDESNTPAKKVDITVTDNETGQIVGVYHTNSKTGQFLYILTPGKNYNITYQTPGHLFYSENIEIPKKTTYYEKNNSVYLHPIVVGSKITLNNIFFDFDKATLRKASNVEINNLV
ncbi:MAG TPA: hypothetical protein VKG26_12890, partial [Bacteroidia bacterium]|nr:hypothetical protein [Bacteroidia bacterium]